MTTSCGRAAAGAVHDGCEGSAGSATAVRQLFPASPQAPQHCCSALAAVHAPARSGSGRGARAWGSPACHPRCWPAATPARSCRCSNRCDTKYMDECMKLACCNSCSAATAAGGDEPSRRRRPAPCRWRTKPHAPRRGQQGLAGRVQRGRDGGHLQIHAEQQAIDEETNARLAAARRRAAAGPSPCRQRRQRPRCLRRSVSR